MRDLDTYPVNSLLGVWAHPDDEAYLTSALMASVRRTGGRVVVATATRGEHGTPDPATWPPERLAPIREHELADSLKLLDVTEHHWLDHHDGAMADVDRELGVAQVQALIDDTRPDAIVTFGPEGMTGHTDHCTISDWTTEAWRRAGCPGELWYATHTPEWHQIWDQVNTELGVWFDGARPPSTPREQLAAQVHCDGDLLEIKLAALRAHASQTRPLEDVMGSQRFTDWFATESFAPAPRDGSMG